MIWSRIYLINLNLCSSTFSKNVYFFEGEQKGQLEKQDEANPRKEQQIVESHQMQAQKFLDFNTQISQNRQLGRSGKITQNNQITKTGQNSLDSMTKLDGKVSSKGQVSQVTQNIQGGQNSQNSQNVQNSHINPNAMMVNAMPSSDRTR